MCSTYLYRNLFDFGNVSLKIIKNIMHFLCEYTATCVSFSSKKKDSRSFDRSCTTDKPNKPKTKILLHRLSRQSIFLLVCSKLYLWESKINVQFNNRTALCIVIRNFYTSIVASYRLTGCIGIIACIKDHSQIFHK